LFLLWQQLPGHLPTSQLTEFSRSTGSCCQSWFSALHSLRDHHPFCTFGCAGFECVVADLRVHNLNFSFVFFAFLLICLILFSFFNELGTSMFGLLGASGSGQVRYITRPKSSTMSVTRQLMLPPRHRHLKSSYARIVT
jgi:hypothetical protein